MFEMSPLCVNTSLQMLSPLTDSDINVNNVLLQPAPNISRCLRLESLSRYWCDFPTHTLLHNASHLAAYSVGFRSGLFGSHRSRM